VDQVMQARARPFNPFFEPAAGLMSGQ
jgi:hypothetical protein